MHTASRYAWIAMVILFCIAMAILLVLSTGAHALFETRDAKLKSVKTVGIVSAIATTWICAGMSLSLVSIARSCLGTNEQRALAHRVSDLERTRKDALSQQTTELSRIERDLHDGAQARLVALALDLGMAETKGNWRTW